MLKQGLLLQNTIWNLLGVLVALLLGVFITPVLLAFLGKEQFGIWSIIGSILGYSSLLSFGLNSAVNRWIPRLLIEDDTFAANRIVNTVFVSYSIVAAFLLGCSVYFLDDFSRLFNIASANISIAQNTFIVAVCGFCILLVFNFSAAVLSGLQRYDLISFTDVLSDVLRFLGVMVVSFATSAGLVAIAAVFALSNLFRVGLKFVFAKKHATWMKINPLMADSNTLLEIFPYSLSTFLWSCSIVLQQQSGVLIIGYYYAPEQVADFAVAIILIGVLARIFTAVSAPLKPASTVYETLGDWGQLSRLYISTSRVALALNLFAMMIFVFFGETLLEMWIADSYSQIQYHTLIILFSGALFRFWRTPSFYILTGMGRHRVFGVMSVASSVAAVLLAITLITFLDSGAIAVAIAFSAPEILVTIFIIIPYSLRELRVSWRAEFFDIILPAIFVNAILFGLLIIQSFFADETFFSVICKIIIAICVFLSLGYKILLSDNEKIILSRKFLNKGVPVDE